MTQKMTKLEHRDAANALVQWCNSQQIGRTDALCVLEMVLAKLFMDETTDLMLIGEVFNAHMKRVAHYYADRAAR